jgi:DNA polymerase-3 subunit delta
LRELSAAVSQLAADTPAGVIEESHVNKYHQGKIETTGFDVADKVMDGNFAESLITLRHAIATGTDPVMITSAIASSLRGIAKVSGINRSQKSFELAGELGMAPWQIDKARRQLNGWNANTLTAAVEAIAKCDAQVKGGASDPIYALEQALSRICAARLGAY